MSRSPGGKYNAKKPPNEVRHRLDGTTEITLTQGKSTLIDTSDYEKVRPYRWCAMHNRTGNWYARTNLPTGEKRRTPLLHQMLLPSKPPLEVDHKDGNGLNNRRSNLRRVTRGKNVWNQGKRPNTSSRFVGVTWGEHVQKWLARIYTNGKARHLGCFASEEAAHQARLQAEKKFRPGFFAHRNKVTN
jgi:hypothetical protein